MVYTKILLETTTIVVKVTKFHKIISQRNLEPTCSSTDIASER